MRFKKWLENYQQVFPFASEEDAPDLKKIKRFKSMDNYVKAMSKGGRNTEDAAEKLIRFPANSPLVGGEDIIEFVPNAFIIPASTFSNGKIKPQRSISFVHLKSKEVANPNDEKYNRHRHRILAYWNPDGSFSKEDVLDYFNRPVGGLSFIGSYIDTVWVDPEFRSTQPSLYKALREFARLRGIVSIDPSDQLTSKSFRASQAKYDWKRAQGTS